MSEIKKNISIKKETNVNAEINEEFFFPKVINENHSPFGNNYNNISYLDFATNIGEKVKPKFKIEHAQTFTSNYKMNKDNFTLVNCKENSKTVNDIINDIDMNTQKSNSFEEDNVISLNVINNINRNNSIRTIKNSNSIEMKLFSEMKKIEENINDLQIKSTCTDSLSDTNIILKELTNKYLKYQELEKQFKTICETKYINQKESELKDSDKKIIIFYSIFKRYLINQFNRKKFNTLKIPKYLKNKNINRPKFLENGVKRLIDECAQSLHNLIINLSKKYDSLYKLNIKKQLKFSMRDYKSFFEKSVRSIYYNILPKKKPSIFKNDSEIGKNLIYENIKDKISKVIEREKKDKKVKIKILNIIFSETISFWTILKAFINDNNEITFINEEGVEETIILKGFKTLKDCLFLFKTDEKNEIRERIKLIKEGKVKTRKQRKQKKKAFK